MKKHTGAILSAVLSAVFMLLVPVVWLLGVVFGGMPMVPTLIGLAGVHLDKDTTSIPR